MSKYWKMGSVKKDIVKHIPLKILVYWYTIQIYPKPKFMKMAESLDYYTPNNWNYVKCQGRCCLSVDRQQRYVRFYEVKAYELMIYGWTITVRYWTIISPAKFESTLAMGDVFCTADFTKKNPRNEKQSTNHNIKCQATSASPSFPLLSSLFTQSCALDDKALQFSRLPGKPIFLQSMSSDDFQSKSAPY